MAKRINMEINTRCTCQQVAHLLPFMLERVARSLPSSKISFRTFFGTILSNLWLYWAKSNLWSSSSFKSLLFIPISFSAYFSPHLKALCRSASCNALIWVSLAVDGFTLSKIFWYSSLISRKISFSSFSYLSFTMCLWLSNFAIVSFNPRSSSAVFLWSASALAIEPGSLF